mmetsp:Transcript_11424/g.28866  ORF Transcript_11424/g.28866 Transcript_11424/m.28866 type:complete len:277 (+) Transcript_11424:265-1095(+)
MIHTAVLVDLNACRQVPDDPSNLSAPKGFHKGLEGIVENDSCFFLFAAIPWAKPTDLGLVEPAVDDNARFSGIVCPDDLVYSVGDTWVKGETSSQWRWRNVTKDAPAFLCIPGLEASPEIQYFRLDHHGFASLEIPLLGQGQDKGHWAVRGIRVEVLHVSICVHGRPGWRNGRQADRICQRDQIVHKGVVLLLGEKQASLNAFQRVLGLSSECFFLSIDCVSVDAFIVVNVATGRPLSIPRCHKPRIPGESVTVWLPWILKVIIVGFSQRGGNGRN